MGTWVQNHQEYYGKASYRSYVCDEVGGLVPLAQVNWQTTYRLVAIRIEPGEVILYKKVLLAYDGSIEGRPGIAGGSQNRPAVWGRGIPPCCCGSVSSHRGGRGRLSYADNRTGRNIRKNLSRRCRAAESYGLRTNSQLEHWRSRKENCQGRKSKWKRLWLSLAIVRTGR
jgi:hypothetical protein